MIVIHASLPIDPDKRDEATTLVEELVEASQQENGTIDYRAAVDIADSNLIRLFEQYEDDAAFEAHSETEHFQNFEDQLPGVLAGKPQISRFDVDEATDLA